MAGKMSSILRELEEVQDRLSSLRGGAESEKYALMTRQEELRTQAARLADDVDADCSTQELLIQLAGLRRRRDVLNRQRHHSGPNATGPGHGSSRSQVDVRIERIRSLLAERGIRLR